MTKFLIRFEKLLSFLGIWAISSNTRKVPALHVAKPNLNPNPRMKSQLYLKLLDKQKLTINFICRAFIIYFKEESPQIHSNHIIFTTYQLPTYFSLLKKKKKDLGEIA